MIKYMQNDALRIIGVESVNHFKDSFENQGFTDNALNKWQEVKRRTPGSKWYGFKYGSTVKRPGVKHRKDTVSTNYSPTATESKILVDSGALADSIDYIPDASRRGVYVYSRLAYAKLHNQGGTIRVFGKKLRKVPARQFMGKSRALRLKIRSIIMNDIKKILK